MTIRMQMDKNRLPYIYLPALIPVSHKNTFFFLNSPSVWSQTWTHWNSLNRWWTMNNSSKNMWDVELHLELQLLLKTTPVSIFAWLKQMTG